MHRRRELVVVRVADEVAALVRVVGMVLAGLVRLGNRWVEAAARRSALLDAAGLGLLAWAAAQLAPAAGLAAGGVALLLMSWRGRSR